MSNKMATLANTALAARILPILMNELRLPALVAQKYDAKIVDKQKGATIEVKRAIIFSAQDFVSTITIQDIEQRTVTLKLDIFKDVSFALSATEATFIINNDTQKTEELLKPAASAIADAWDDVAAKMFKENIPFFTKASASTEFHETIIDVREAMQSRKVPRGRNLVLGPKAYALALKDDALRDLDKTGSTEALIEASMGRKFGFNIFETQTNQKHISGTHGGASALTANSTPIVSADGKDIVNTEFNTISITAVDGQKVKKGDHFSISQAGVEYQFIAKEDALAASSVVTVKAFPVYRDAAKAPIVFTSGATATFANTTAGTATEFEVGFGFHKEAAGFAPVALPDFSSAGVDMKVWNADGMTFRISSQYDINEKKLTYSLDTLAGLAIMYPELAQLLLLD